MTVVRSVAAARSSPGPPATMPPLAAQSEENAIAARGRRRTGRLRWVGVGLLALIMAGGVWSRTANFRWVALRALALAYSMYDPFTQETPVEFGPAPQEIAADHRDVAQELNAWFPEYAFTVAPSPATLPAPDAVVFQHKSLADLRVEEFAQAAEPITSGATDVLSLATQVRALTKHDLNGAELTNNNPREILRHAQQGRPLACRPFSILFGSCAIAQGYTSRLLGLSKDGTKFEHAVTEVYVPQFGKWVVVDTDFNIAYRRHGVWQNAAEMHDAWQAMKAQSQTDLAPAEWGQVARSLGIEMVVLGGAGKSLRQTNLISSGTRMAIMQYEHVLYHTRNNYLSGSYPKATFHYVLQAPEKTSPPPFCPEGELLISREAVYFPVGRTRIDVVAESGKNQVELRFSSWTPNFDRFEVRTNDGDWRVQASETFRLAIEPGPHTVEARKVNLAGLRGEIAALKIEVEAKN